jgi:nitrite reductase (NADH) large subunit
MHFEERVGLEYIQSKLDTPEKIKSWADKLPSTIKNPWSGTGKAISPIEEKLDMAH